VIWIQSKEARVDTFFVASGTDHIIRNPWATNLIWLVTLITSVCDRWLLTARVRSDPVCSLQPLRVTWPKYSLRSDGVHPLPYKPAVCSSMSKYTFIAFERLGLLLSVVLCIITILSSSYDTVDRDQLWFYHQQSPWPSVPGNHFDRGQVLCGLNYRRDALLTSGPQNQFATRTRSWGISKWTASWWYKWSRTEIEQTAARTLSSSVVDNFAL
jgi:hypothetical protein